MSVKNIILKVQNVIQHSILTAILVILVSFVFSSCRSDSTSGEYVAPKNKFNNDSACNALLIEYQNSQDGNDTLKAMTIPVLEKIDFATVSGLFMENCIPCHQKNGNAPFELATYEQIKRKSAVIRDVILHKIMPPFMADQSYSRLINAPRMTDYDRNLILRWVDDGTINKSNIMGLHGGYRKNVKSIQKLHPFTASQHTITSNTDTYQCFDLDLHLTRDTFIRGIKYHSTNPRVLHHITVLLDTNAKSKYPNKCWDCFKSGFVNELIQIDAWSKGMTPVKFTDDFAIRIPKGSHLILQTHYGNENLKGQVEKTTLNLEFCSRPKRQVTFTSYNNLKISIPANTIKTESIVLDVDSDISVIGGGPHCHFLAKRIEVFAITPKIKKINLLRIKNWDYLWQGNYMLEKPIHIPKNSKIYMNTVFDNTENNPTQPNNPIVDVKYNLYSNQEMMVLSLYYFRYQAGDTLLKPYKIWHY